MDRLLALLGVDARPFRALLRASLLIDLRSQHYRRATRAGGDFLLTPLFWVVAQNLFVSLLVAAAMRQADVFSYAVACIGMSMVLLACSLVVEFHEVVLNPEDGDLVGPWPLSPRTYAAVRAANLLFYVALMGAALNLFPLTFALLIRNDGLLFVPAYALAAAAACLATTGVVIGLYLLLAGLVGGRRLKDVLSFAQLGMMLLGLYGLQLLARQQTETAQLPGRSWLEWTPPGWFAGLVEAAVSSPRPVHAWQLAAAVLLLAGSSVYCFRRLAQEYGRLHTGFAAPPGRSPAASHRGTATTDGSLLRLLTRSRAEAAALWICWTLFRRDTDVQFRTYPALGAALGFFLIGWLGGQLADPFDPAGREAAPAIVILYLLALAVPVAAYNLSFSRDYAAAWVFHTAPLSSPAVFAAGVRKAVLYGMVLPQLVVLFTGFALLWQNALHAAIHCALGVLLCAAAGHWAVLGVIRDWPFSRRYVRGEMSGRVALHVGALMVVATAAGTVQLYAYRSPPALASFAAGLLLAVALLGWLAQRSVTRGCSAAGPERSRSAGT